MLVPRRHLARALPLRRGRQARFAAVAAALLLALPSASPVRAAVAVLSNRTEAPLSLTTVVDDASQSDVALGPGDSRPVFGLKKLHVRWHDGQKLQQSELVPGRAYYFGQTADGEPVTLQQIGLNDRPGPQLIIAEDELLLDPAPTIKVKVMVDDDERRRRAAWEPVLRQRIADASAVLQAHCGVGLRLVGFDTWDSDDLERDFQRSLAEFEREVTPGDADVAIGFSSQYAVERGRYHMGGTRRTMHTHILLKERARGILEVERLELLVHELGHLLGAAHSPEPTSVMRPVLTRGLQRFAGARVQFDPVNTLAMSLMADEMRLRRVRSLSDITPLTRRRLSEIYAALDPTLPDDPAAGMYQKLVGSAAGTAIIDDARKIMAQVVRVANLKDKAPLDEISGEAIDEKRPPRSDLLLAWYVRQAAAAASLVDEETAPQAFLLAMGAALDDQGMLAKLPLLSNLNRRLESPTERDRRLAVLGQPTMRGRGDLAKHFFVSAYLVPVLGSQQARTAGLLKEFSDSHGGSGFSFVDMAANRAGIVFAHAVLAKRLPLDRVAREFTIEAVLPPVDDLREGMQANEFAEGFGGLTDARLDTELRKIEARAAALAIYREP